MVTDTNNRKDTASIAGSAGKKSSARIKGVAIIVICLIVPVLLLFSAFQNPAWIKSPLAKRCESFLSGALMGNINVATVPTDQILHPIVSLDEDELKQIENGKYSIISSTDINAQGHVDQRESRDTFVIATISPVDLSGKNIQEARKAIDTVYNEAYRGRIDAVVESTEADRLLASRWGRSKTARLHEAGVVRCVVFDGGHHVGSLGLKPDILLIPSMFYDGKLYATHAFTRDSVLIEKLKQTIEREYVGSMVVQFPRIGVPVKNSNAMGKLAYQSLLNISRLTSHKNNATDTNPSTDKTDDKSNTNTNNTASNYGESENTTSTTAASNNGNNEKSARNKFIPMRKSIVFVSCDVGNNPTKEEILRAIEAEVAKQVEPGQRVRRVYAGITYGIDQFPQIKSSVNFTDKELQSFLSQKLPYYTEIMSEPISTWDIVKTRLGI